MEIRKYQLGKMLELRKKFQSSKNDAVDGGFWRELIEKRGHFKQGGKLIKNKLL